MAAALVHADGGLGAAVACTGSKANTCQWVVPSCSSLQEASGSTAVQGQQTLSSRCMAHTAKPCCNLSCHASAKPRVVECRCTAVEPVVVSQRLLPTAGASMGRKGKLTGDVFHWLPVPLCRRSQHHAACVGAMVVGKGKAAACCNNAADQPFKTTYKKEQTAPLPHSTV